MSWWKRVLVVVAIAAIPVALAVATLLNRPDDPEITRGEIALESPGEDTEETAGGADAPPAQGTDPAGEARAEENAGSPASEDESPDPGADGPTAAALRALGRAEDETGGRAHAVESDDGRWEVHVATGAGGATVLLDGAGAEVLGTQSEDLDSEDRAALDAARVSLAEAIRIATGEVGGEVDDAQLDGDDRLWEIEVRAPGGDVEVIIHAVTGEIVEVD